MEHINHLVTASNRLKALIDDLLILSRTGRVINTPRAFAWEPVIASVLSDLRDLIARKNAVVHVEGQLPPVVGDPDRVVQLLNNLVANGLKYNKGARPEVVIGYRGEEANGQGVFFVRDNGIGIDPVYHEQIFRIFRRLHHSDEVGQGATFLFDLPRHKPAPRPEVPLGRARNGTNAAAAAGGR